MGRDLDISTNFSNLPPQGSVGRPGDAAVSGPEAKLRKSAADPLPGKADLAQYPERLRNLFRYQGILMMLQRKLNALTGQKYRIVAARGNRVCISDDGEVYVGLDFVESYLDEEEVLAGVLAHEWGHFPNLRQRPVNMDQLSWDEIYRLRREEETKADIFCGRVLFHLRYHYRGLIAFLKVHDDPKEKSNKYHTVKSRERIIAESYHSEAKRTGMAAKLKLSDAVYGDPIHTTRIIGA